MSVYMNYGQEVGGTVDDASQIPYGSGSVKSALDGMIESSSNSNGTYIKYADGTLICMKKVASGLITSWSAWGSVYESPEISLGSWAYNFLSNPIVSVTLTSSGSGGWLEYVKGVSTTSAGSIRIVRPNSVQSSLDANVMAIGRWK